MDKESSEYSGFIEENSDLMDKYIDIGVESILMEANKNLTLILWIPTSLSFLGKLLGYF